MNGGYVLIDVKGLNLASEETQTYAGLYAKIKTASAIDKTVVLDGAVNGDDNVSPIVAYVTLDGTDYVLSAGGITITVESDDDVTVTASGGGTPETPYTVIDLDGLDIYGPTAGNFADILSALNEAKPTTKPILFTNFVSDTNAFACAFGTLINDNNTSDATFYLVDSKVVLGAESTVVTKVSYA